MGSQKGKFRNLAGNTQMSILKWDFILIDERKSTCLKDLLQPGKKKTRLSLAQFLGEGLLFLIIFFLFYLL